MEMSGGAVLAGVAPFAGAELALIASAAHGVVGPLSGLVLSGGAVLARPRVAQGAAGAEGSCRARQTSIAAGLLVGCVVLAERARGALDFAAS